MINILSNELEINNGVPKGILLSPIPVYYILYVSALENPKLQGRLFSKPTTDDGF